MENKIKESIDNIMYQINSSKRKGKKSLKAKVYQADANGVLFHLVGMNEGEEGVSYLKQNGYSVVFETNDKQVSLTYNMKGELAGSSSKDLKTTSMIISW